MAEPDARVVPQAIVASLLILGIGSISSFAIGVKILFSPSQMTDTSLPDWYLIMNGAMSLVLGIFYLWIARMIYTKHPTARILAISIALANGIFSLTRLPVGAIPLVLNLGLLAVLASKPGREWLAQ